MKIFMKLLLTFFLLNSAHASIMSSCKKDYDKYEGRYINFEYAVTCIEENLRNALKKNRCYLDLGPLNELALFFEDDNCKHKGEPLAFSFRGAKEFYLCRKNIEKHVHTHEFEWTMIYLMLIEHLNTIGFPSRTRLQRNHKEKTALELIKCIGM